MHLAVPTSLPGRRRPLRSATLIRRRTTRRRRRTWTVALIISALALGSASIALAVVTVTLRPLPLGRFVPLPNRMNVDAAPVDDGPAPLTVQSEPAGARVVVDGRVRGRTPLQIHTSIGRHAVLVDAPDSISMSEPVERRRNRHCPGRCALDATPNGPTPQAAVPRRSAGGCRVPFRRRVQLAVALPDHQAGQPRAPCASHG